MRFNGLELIVAPSLAVMSIIGIDFFFGSAKENIARVEGKDVVDPVIVAPVLDEASSSTTVAVWAGGILIGVVLVAILWMEIEVWLASRSLQKTEQRAATLERAKEKKRSKRAKAEARRASCAALAVKTPSVDLQAVLTDFIAANTRWADGHASGSYGDNPRLRHAVEVVESACLRVLSDNALMACEEAHARLVEPLRGATRQLNDEMSEAVTAKLADMSLDLDLAQRAFDTGGR